MKRPGERRVYTVSEISTRVVKVLEASFADAWVQGEVSEFVAHGSGHWYFNLKDEKAQLRAVMFKFQNLYLRFRPQDGMEVVCRGRISAYAPRSSYQLLVEWMEPRGRGALSIEFEKLKERLAREGLFDPARKRPVPSPLRRIAIITSITGAALQDMIRILRERDPGIEVLIIPARVQGEGAALELARALETANRPQVAAAPGRRPLEAIIIGRGGGSQEDLWAFNEEVLARAIFASRIPVISAVGHEVDVTIADLVADLRAPTPTAAAEMAAAGRPQRLQAISHHLHRLRAAMRGRLEGEEDALFAAASHLRDPGRLIREYMIRADELAQRMARAARAGVDDCARSLSAARAGLLARDPRLSCRLEAARLEGLSTRLAAGQDLCRQSSCHRLDNLDARLQVLSPRATLARGFSIARDRQGRVLREAARVGVGDPVEVILERGGLECEVTGIKPEEKQ